MATNPTDEVHVHPGTAQDILKRAVAQADRMALVNDRQRASLGRHVAFLEEKGLLDEFNEWQHGH